MTDHWHAPHRTPEEVRDLLAELREEYKEMADAEEIRVYGRRRRGRR